eukprot:SAG25_NODE_1012_length_4300_cov_2.456082_7_plen_70_part_01
MAGKGTMKKAGRGEDALPAIIGPLLTSHFETSPLKAEAPQNTAPRVHMPASWETQAYETRARVRLSSETL